MKLSFPLLLAVCVLLPVSSLMGLAHSAARRWEPK